MPDDAKPRKMPPRRKAKERDYEVGYAKPPKDTRFKPGQSGNPRGRPKGARNKKTEIPRQNEERLKQVILEECYRKIGISDGDKLVEIPVIQAVVRQIALTAAKGNQRSQRMLTENLQWVERERKAEHNELLQTMIQYKVDGEKELARRKELGIEGPRMYPHPDDIHINFATDEIDIHGPMCKDEEYYVETLSLKVSTERQIIDAVDDLAERPNSKAKRARVKSLRSVLAKIEAKLKTHPGRGRFEGVDLSSISDGDVDP